MIIDLRAPNQKLSNRGSKIDNTLQLLQVETPLQKNYISVAYVVFQLTQCTYKNNCYYNHAHFPYQGNALVT